MGPHVLKRLVSLCFVGATGTARKEVTTDFWQIYNSLAWNVCHQPCAMPHKLTILLPPAHPLLPQARTALVPGDCWAFAGQHGQLVIALSHYVKLSHVTLAHIPEGISPTGTITSAPKEFSIFVSQAVQSCPPPGCHRVAPKGLISVSVSLSGNDDFRQRREKTWNLSLRQGRGLGADLQTTGESPHLHSRDMFLIVCNLKNTTSAANLPDLLSLRTTSKGCSGSWSCSWGATGVILTSHACTAFGCTGSWRPELVNTPAISR